MWILYVLVGLVVLAGVLYLLGNYTFWLPPLRTANIPRVVMLHQVTPHAEASGMNMPPAKFEELLQYLGVRMPHSVLFLKLISTKGKKMCSRCHLMMAF